MVSELELVLIGAAAVVGLAALVFWAAMIRDCWVNTLPGSSERYVWLLIIVLGKVIGAAIYYLVRKRAAPVTAAEGDG